jgi:AcrR family transcriptional regulator
MIMSERPPGTRSRIQEVALELFTEHGYEATSLREIAERLGVTKAALYYHFKTKEDIVSSFMDDRVAALDEIIAWGRAQPKTDESRREVLHRYSEMLATTGQHRVMRFLERNQTALRGHAKSERMRDCMFSVMDLLSDPGDPLPVRLKSSLALFAMHATWFIDPDHTRYTDEERAKSALQIALELLDSAQAEKGRTASR